MSGKLMTFNLAVSTNCLIQTMGSVELSDTMTVLIKVIKTKLELLLLVYLHRL